MSTTLSTTYWPRVITLADSTLVRITRLDTTDIAYDIVESAGEADPGVPIYRTLTPALACAPLAGFGPAAEAWPDDATLAAHIAAQRALPVPVSVPAEVSRARFLIAVYDLYGITVVAIQAQIEAIEDEATRYKAGVWFANAQTFRRDNAYLLALAAALGRTSADLDAAFIHAGQLTD